MLQDPYGEHYGYTLSRKAHVLSGTLYPILDRMLAEGWATDRWEDPGQNTGRPARRYYRLTNKGRHHLGQLLL